ncbi:BMC domain-containing protein [Enterococcus dongliensis]|uniref:BMC domain-containing protein n=1 Tax=Enterococcus dongliensis TaxID=2559925 RepID=UPI00288FDE00|nr:BMC domain-containing protein [Enterococcus dongliensis]MDT2640312.1 BMC domain-containing protein [Enterococcus dongliensis]MDT2677576.1 BMC domain-containing protein [Enterococcus dongliensis]MDT2703873.1 BMC domain-containing protein [Enterococcus dongliensis]
MSEESTRRVIEESVPGKQITLAHVIASPVNDVYQSLGIDEAGAIGILTLSPFETAMIAADIAVKVADVSIGFLDRFTGSVVITGDIESVETSLREVVRIFKEILEFNVVDVTRT